jgi:hypothetical protein
MKRIAAGVMMFMVIGGIGLIRSAFAEGEFLNCEQSWKKSSAAGSCGSISKPSSGASGDVPMAQESGFRSCTINVRCQKSTGLPSAQNEVFDITQVPDLINCNGVLKVGRC